MTRRPSWQSERNSSRQLVHKTVLLPIWCAPRSKSSLRCITTTCSPRPFFSPKALSFHRRHLFCRPWKVKMPTTCTTATISEKQQWNNSSSDCKVSLSLLMEFWGFVVWVSSQTDLFDKNRPCFEFDKQRKGIQIMRLLLACFLIRLWMFWFSYT